METQPDSALHILQHLSPNEYKSDESRALYGLLMIQALDKKLLPLQPDSLLDFSIAYYQKHPDKDRLATCYLYKGQIYKYAFQYETAINCYLKAFDILGNKENNILLGRINYNIADIYLYQREYNQATKKYILAYNYFKKANLSSSAFYSLINIGKSYSQAKLYNKAQPYFYRVYRDSNDSIIKGFAIQYIGVNFYSMKQLDSALHYLRKVIPYPYLGINRAVRYYYLADVFFDLHQLDSADFYANKSFKYNPDIRTQKECYRIIVNCKTIDGNIKELNKYMAKYQDCADSIQRIDTQTKGSVIETIHSTKQEVEKKQSWLWYLFYTLILVILAAISIYIFKHRSNIKDRQWVEEEHLQQKAVMRKQVIGDKRTVLQQKIKEIKAFQIAEQKASNLQEKEEQIKKIYNDLLHINDQDFFFEEMDIVLNKLVTKLRKRHNDVKPKELMWCCLHLLKTPSHDMLILLDYKTHNSLKTLKGRLSDKFELENASLLGAFLINLLSED
jgi:tetratricopeptide (TPR) repeat protein